jgi:hypothetical protein
MDTNDTNLTVKMNGISKGSWWGGIATLLLGLVLATFHLDATITNHEDRIHVVETRQDHTEAVLDKLIESQTSINQQQAVMNASLTSLMAKR